MVHQLDLRNARSGVPNGVYCSPFFDDEQDNAIAWGRELGEELAMQHPSEIIAAVSDFTHYQTYEAIGAIYVSGPLGLGRENVTSPEVLRHAVGHAVSLLLSDEANRNLLKRRKAIALERTVGGYETPEGKARLRSAWEKRQELHGAPVGALILGRGQIPWGQEEQDFLLELLGKNPQKDRFESISRMLNERFHLGQNVRTPEKVNTWYRDVRRKARKNPQNEFWQKFLLV